MDQMDGTHMRDEKYVTECLLKSLKGRRRPRWEDIKMNKKEIG
jgi:hypothetical protein